MAAKLYEPLMEFTEKPIEGVNLKKPTKCLVNGILPFFFKQTLTRTPYILLETRSAW